MILDRNILILCYYLKNKINKKYNYYITLQVIICKDKHLSFSRDFQDYYFLLIYIS